MAKGGLGKWFGEKWVDIKTGEACGRSGSEKGSRPYPACRPAAVASKLSSTEKTAMKRKKSGPKMEKWPVTASGKRRAKTK
jgi:hypothetical protein